MLQQIQSLINYVKVFGTVRDIQAFRRVAYQNGALPEVLNVRATGRIPLRIRPRTSDAAVLWDTFFEKFHLPPANIRDDAVIFDLGANVGYTAVHFASLYPKATIVAVELDKNNLEAAQLNLQQMDHCKLIHAAVWSEDGSVSYDTSEAEWGFHVDIDQSHSNGATVVAKTIETIMMENDISAIDYVKMDIEGAEWPVLSSGAVWLRKVKMMKVELHPKFNKEATYDNCSRVLNSSGFTCSRDSRHWNTLLAVRN